MKTKNLIFDLDGTLWDATPPVAEGWNRILQREIPLTSNDVRKLAGLPMDIIFEKLDVEPDPELLRRLIASEHQVIEETGADLFPGIRQTIEQLAKCYNLYIVSNCQQGYIELFLRKMDMQDLFIDHLCWGDTNQPKGITIQRLMTHHGMNNAVYIGDTRGDQVAAEVSGIPFIFVTYGFGQVEEPVEKIDHIGELLEVFPCP